MTFEQFLLLAGAHLLAVASPGPDFAVVSRHAIAFGRRCALWVALGVGSGILVHMAYTWAGVALLLKTYHWLEVAFSVVAALYLLWMAKGALMSSKGMTLDREGGLAPGPSAAFRRGFLTNALNPKATLFFLALFGSVLDASPQGMQMLMVSGYLALATALWFVLLGWLLTAGPLGRFLADKGYWIDRVLGVFLLLLAGRLIYGLFW
ncbi:LysE family translocator [Gallaecimonas xiamenensis]|uniref:Lysine exporter protein LysE/YggA n=1 Tax=Gallaecimonas xiamenensis 3-C-1 TaxID=745411 RepID=K2K1T0_9GAMM|nr:LysE family translocator [Gallaecimonas xiamenensis]EKE76789.1 lysine exporter protein LysE/YggA [Gallaecimonas xiamenensis 3-C-1]